jgi:hypothetical protein
MKLSKGKIALLACAIIASGAVGFISIKTYNAGSAKTVINKYEGASLSMNMVVAAFLKNNSLYGQRIVTNPQYIFPNITKNVELFLNVDASETPSMESYIFLNVEQVIISGTTPSWNKTTEINYTSIIFQSHVSLSTQLPNNFTSVLSYIYQTDRELNLTPGDPSLIFRVAGGVIAGNATVENTTSLYLNFTYNQNYYFGEHRFNALNYSYVQTGGKQSYNGQSSIEMKVTEPASDAGDPNNSLLYVGIASIGISASAALVLASGIERRRRPVSQKFDKEFRENIIKSKTDPTALGQKSICVAGFTELRRLIEITGQPPMIFEGELYDTYFVISGDVVYYLKVRKMHRAG